MKNEFNFMNDCEFAYIAGFFDGEGCVSLRWAQSSNKKHIGLYNVRYKLIVGISNTNREVLLQLKGGYGGYVRKKNYKKSTHPTWTTCYEWQVGSEKAIKFLRDIYPYAKIKKQEIKTALEFENFRENNVKVYSKKGYPKEYYGVAEQYRRKLFDMKSRNTGKEFYAHNLN